MQSFSITNARNYSFERNRIRSFGNLEDESENPNYDYGGHTAFFSVMFMSISELVDNVSLPLFRGIIRPQIATVATTSMSKTIRFLAPILSENQSESEQEEYW